MIQPEIVARHIGQEQQPIVVIDGFHPDPQRLCLAAQSMPFEPAHRHYPGIRAPLPPDYFAQVRLPLVSALVEVFGHAGAIDLIDASFSIATTPPAELTIEQRLPHVDAVQPNRIALVHYLSRDDRNGTAFFRHRATGYETIDEQRSTAYFARLNGELRHAAPPQAYVDDSNSLFERIEVVEALYNRAVIYRSANLHSGAIRPGSRLDADPATGRLTVTAFLSAG